MALLHGHPPELPVVGVDDRPLPRLPAHRHQLDGLVAEDEVPRVHVVAEEHVAVEGRGIDRGLQAEVEQPVARDGLALEGAQVVDVLTHGKDLLGHRLL